MYDDNAYPELSGSVARHKRGKPTTIRTPRRAKLTLFRCVGWRRTVHAPENQAAKFCRVGTDFLRYRGLAITPQAIRGGAPLSVELLTACTTSAVPPLLKTE